MNIKETVLITLEENGIYIPDDLDEELDMDSITFISIAVCIEEKMQISIPDEYLAIDKFKTINSFIENINIILNSLKNAEKID